MTQILFLIKNNSSAKFKAHFFSHNSKAFIFNSQFQYSLKFSLALFSVCALNKLFYNSLFCYIIDFDFVRTMCTRDMGENSHLNRFKYLFHLLCFKKRLKVL